MENHILKANKIVKQYGDYFALNNVDLSIPRGSVFGLLGPNGAGKTTLMRIINQIIAADSGEVLFNGSPLNRKHISQIGYLPEERGLYKKMKVGEQSLYLAQLKGMNRFEATNKLKYWFEKLEIQSWWNKRIEELSKGMAQKVQFAVTVIHNPDLLIFDEPFSGFDPVNTALIRNEILKLRKQGTSIIFSTHRMESVEEICDEISLINNGETLLQGEIINIKNNFRNNIFSIEMKTEIDNLSEKFTILNKKENILEIKIQEGSNSKELINELLQKSDIISFNEKIPSMEDIFIKTVSGE
ncbi:MAG: ABC transporter ATP-binding protein [Flavobacteriales bacterium]|jgi:ABC-2 type transport system ATP-binding protein|nr:ABC transporter ATP-binding protein [Flavobacteriales bacterium]MBT6013917.1 ABC transporter ATP-binding protein [Flavobacteriales bacterium]MBT7726220.1 ABC transporter ATP-binding protein [Flavobacteriales bacterium]